MPASPTGLTPHAEHLLKYIETELCQQPEGNRWIDPYLAAAALRLAPRYGDHFTEYLCGLCLGKRGRRGRPPGDDSQKLRNSEIFFEYERLRELPEAISQVDDSGDPADAGDSRWEEKPRSEQIARRVALFLRKRELPAPDWKTICNIVSKFRRKMKAH